jgi:gamma-glutamyltranspeptidase/glutathione hydrolase
MFSVKTVLATLFLAVSSTAAPSKATSDKLGAVSSENYICSQIGIGLLQAGGNAADALVGTLFCVGVVAPYHSGIGGGGFMLVRAPNGSYEFIDFRETMPIAGFQDMYNNNTNASLYGGLASGIPGELRGLEHLHNNYGKLPWATVMKPAISVAENGFPVNKDTVRYMASGIEGFQNFLVEDPNWAIDFAPNGTLVGLGDTLTRKRYAATLDTIATHGANAFYTGPIANATIEALQAATPKGAMTLEDLANYSVAIQTPLHITYRDKFKITSTSAPSSGEVLLSVMKTIDGYSGFGEEALVNMSTQRLDEAIRFAYGQVRLESQIIAAHH